MSTYDLYRQKMLKLAAIKNTIVRFRVLILSVLAAIIALVFTLLGLKGTFTQDFTLKANDLVYGDTIVFQTPAKAMMSGVYYEYAEDGSSGWSRKVPTRPGTYSVRAVAKGGFGMKYGKSASFTISPRALVLSVADETIVYGYDPAVSAALQAGDTLAEDELQFVFDDYAAADTEVAVLPASVKIVNASGEDVTACYSISLPKASIHVAPRATDVGLQDFTATYRGAPIDDYVPVPQAALGQGDTIDFGTQVCDASGVPLAGGGMPRDAGRYTVKILQDTVRVLHGETDVTGQYAFTFRDGSFTVRPRDIIVTPHLAAVEYDGVGHDYTGDYEIEDGEVLAADKDTFESVLSAHFAGTTLGGERVTDALSVTEAGTYEIVLAPAALVNYTLIDSGKGRFTLRQRELHVRTFDCSKTYDNTPLYGIRENYDAAEVLLSGSLVSRHRFTALEADATYIIDVKGSGTQNDTPYYIFDSENADKTYNYKIIYDAHGSLFITPAALTLRPSMGANSVEYDGIEHTYGGGFVVTSGEVYSSLALKAYFTGTTAGDRTISLADKAGFVVDAGAYALIFDESFVAENNPNYGITFDTGTFTVSKVAVKITTGSGSKPYDGTPLKAGDALVSEPLSSRSLPDRHTVEVVRESIQYSFVTVAETLGQTNNNVHTCRIENGNKEDVSYNFIITYAYGTLRIERRAVMLVPVVKGEGVVHEISSNDGYTKAYDGTMPDFDYVALYALETDAPNGGAFVGNEEDTYAPIFTVTSLLGRSLPHVDTYTVQIEMPSEELCQNYVFSLSSCTLTVTEYAVTVYTGSGSKTYDGAPMSALSLGVSAPSATLPQGHTLEIVSGTLTAVCHVTDTYANNNVHECIVLNEEGEDVGYDFVFTYVYGTLTITPRPVTITPDITQVNGVDISSLLSGNAIIYDGDVYENFGYTAVNLANGETLDNRCVAYVRGTLASGDRCTRATFVIVAGDYTVFFDKAELESAFTDYTFTVNEAAFVVLPRELTVTTADASFTYNGQAQYTYGFTLTSGTLAPGRFASGNKIVVDIENVSTVTHVSDTKAGNNETKFLVVGAAEDENDHSSDIHYNYKIEYVCGTLTVNPRTVRIKPLNNCTKEYDGEAFAYPNTPHNFIDIDDMLLGGDDLTVSVYFTGELLGGKPIDADSYTILLNEPTAKAFTSGGVGQFEDYTFDYSGTDTLVISPRAISIRPIHDEKEYDGEAYDYFAQFDKTAGNFTYITGSKTLVEGDTITITAVSYAKDSYGVVTPIDAGLYHVRIDAYEGGGGFKAGNYDITLPTGPLEITPRVVTVTPYMDPDTVEYDTTEYSYGGLFRDDNNRILAKDDGMVLHGAFLYVLFNTAEKSYSVLHACEYTIVLDDAQDYPNYTFVDSGNGRFTITQRRIGFLTVITEGKKGVTKIDSHEYEKEYDGDGVEFADFETFYWKSNGVLTTERGLLGDDKLIVELYHMIAGGTEFPNAARYVVEPSYSGESRYVTNDYNVLRLQVSLTITPRKVRLVPTVSGDSDYTKVYDGTVPDFSYEAVHLGADGTPDGQPAFVLRDEEGYTPTFTATGAMGRLLPHVDEYTVTIGTPSDELCKNYAFTIGSGRLTITPRPVSIVPLAGSKVYDGSAYVYPQYSGNFAYAEGSLPFVEYPSAADVPIKIAVSFSRAGGAINPVHAGSYEMAITSYTGAIENAYDYEINLSGSALLTIEKRAVVIVVFVINADGSPMPDNEKIYDGKGVLYGFKSNRKDNEEEPGFVNDDEFDGGFVPSYSVTELNGRSLPHAGQYTISLSYTLSDAVEADYEIAECRDCVFTILPREITVTPILADVEYDGEEHGYTGDYEIVRGEVLDADKAAFEASLYVYFTGTTLGGETVENALSVTEAGTYALVLAPAALTDYEIIDSGLGSFTITPKEIHVRTLPNSKTYDGTPLYGIRERYDEAEVLISGELVGGHRFTALQSEAAYILNVLDSGMPNDTPYHVFDRENRDKTHNYTIVYDAYGSLFISAASVTLRPKMDTDSVEYDGTAHAYDGGYETVSGEVCSGLLLTAYFTGTTAGGYIISIYDHAESVIDAGVYTLAFDENIVRANNPNYTITCESGSFKILKCAVTVTTGSGSKEYDGTPLKAGDASVTAPTPDRPLPNDHSIEIDEYSITYSFVNVAETLGQHNNNEHTCRIVSADGQDVSYNYVLSYEYGTLTISKRNVCLTVTVSGDGVTYSESAKLYEKEYDGTSPSFWYTAAHLTDGNPDSLAAFIGSDASGYAPEFSIVGVHRAALPDVDIYLMDVVMPSEVLCENYAFTLRQSRLGISPRYITVITGTKSLAYNGTAQSWQEYTVADRADGQSALLPGHELSLKTLFERTDVGEYENENTYEIIGEGVFGSYVSNCRIRYEYGTLTITPASIRIAPTLRSSSERYGDESTEPVLGFEILSGEIFGSDTLSLRTAYTRTLVSGGTITEYGGVTDAGTYTVGYDQTYLDENNPNYAITFETAVYTLTKRSITLAADSASREYDGTPLTAPTATLGGDGLGSGDVLAAIAGTITAVTDYTDTPVVNETEFTVMHGTRNVTHNYDISYGTPGTLTVYKRNITIKPAGDEWEYDGKTHTTKYVNAAGLADTDVLVAKVDTVTEVGPRPNGDGEVNKTEYDIYRGTICVSGNYNITYETGGKLIIKPRKVTIHPTVEIVYDGVEHDYTFDAARDVTSGSFVEGDAEKVKLTYRMSGTAYNNTTIGNAQYVTDAAVYTVLLDACTLGDLNDCYDITCESGTFEIKRRVLAVRPSDLTTETYDGTFTQKRHGEEDYVVVEYGDRLADGHTYRILSTTAGWNVAEGVKTKRSILIENGKVFDAAMRDVTYNYDVYTHYENKLGDDLFKSDFYGKITVPQIEITVRPIAPKDGDGNKRDYFFKGDAQAVLPSSCTDEDWNALFTVVDGDVIDGHVLQVDRERTVLRKAGTKSTWLVMKVTDAEGHSVMGGYKIVFEKDDDSYVEVRAAKLTIEKNEDGSFTVSLEGKGTLTAEADGTFLLYGGHYLRIEDDDGSYTVFRYSSDEEVYVFEDQYYEIKF